MSVDRFLVPFEGLDWMSPWCPSSYRHRRSSPWNEWSLLEGTLKDVGRFRFGPSLNSAFDMGMEEHVEKGDDKNPAKYTMSVPLGKNIDPQNLNVTLKDQVMLIEFKKEEKSTDGNSRVYQEISQQFTLPENADLKEVKSTLTPEGILKIEAPLSQPQIEVKEPPKAIDIPINKL